MWHDRIKNTEHQNKREMTADFYLFVEFCAVSGRLNDISEK